MFRGVFCEVIKSKHSTPSTRHHTHPSACSVLFFFLSAQLSCDVLPTQARLPKVHFLLTGVGTHIAKTPSRQNNPTGSLDSIDSIDSLGGGARTQCGEGRQLYRTSEGNDEAPSVTHPRREYDVTGRGDVGGAGGGRASRVGVGEGGTGIGGAGGGARAGGLYWVLQREFDKALLSDDLTPSSCAAAEADPLVTSPTHLDDTAGVHRNRRTHGARECIDDDDDAVINSSSTPVQASPSSSSSATRRKGRKNTSSSSSPHVTERSQVGAGRALFGGFVPSRSAPAASLHDFGGGSTGDATSGGSGGDFGVSGLGSIYGSAAGGSVGVGGTLEALDDARVRQYTLEATARAQRLGAEKRNSRISRSKRQG